MRKNELSISRILDKMFDEKLIMVPIPYINLLAIDHPSYHFIRVSILVVGDHGYVHLSDP